MLANYPNRDGRIANGVGLDTPASTIAPARGAARTPAIGSKGCRRDGQALVEALLAGVTNDLARARRAHASGSRCPLEDYLASFDQLSAKRSENSRSSAGARRTPIRMSSTARSRSRVLPLGNVVVGIQPARGYHIDPSASYHDPDLPPPHGYLAFYAWLRQEFGAHAIVHMGKHGNLEWLPGKALALSADCFPEAALGPLPHIYPFIVNDPGEGARRSGARPR